MRILLAGGRLRASGYGGGGTNSLYTLCKWLRRRHSVTFYGDVDRYSRWVVSSYIRWRTFPNLPFVPLHVQKFFTELIVSSHHLREIWSLCNPDIYICDCGKVFTPGLSKLQDTPSVLFIRDRFWGDALELDFELDREYPLHKRLLQQITFWFRALRNRQIAHRFSIIVANSYFIQSCLAGLGIASEVVYPFIELDRYIVPDIFLSESQFVTLASGSLPKGLAIVYEIARRLTHYKFLIVPLNTNRKWRQRILSLPNVTVWSRQEDMRKVWRVTKVLLVPSLCHEAFGRVPIEAGINGIPSIASKIGGLPESVGDGGILVSEPRNVEMWCEAVRTLVEDEALRQHLGERARKHAERFRSELMLERFKNVLWRRLNIRI